MANYYYCEGSIILENNSKNQGKIRSILEIDGGTGVNNHKGTLISRNAKGRDEKSVEPNKVAQIR